MLGAEKRGFVILEYVVQTPPLLFCLGKTILQTDAMVVDHLATGVKAHPKVKSRRMISQSGRSCGTLQDNQGIVHAALPGKIAGYIANARRYIGSDDPRRYIANARQYIADAEYYGI